MKKEEAIKICKMIVTHYTQAAAQGFPSLNILMGEVENSAIDTLINLAVKNSPPLVNECDPEPVPQPLPIWLIEEGEI